MELAPSTASQGKSGEDPMEATEEMVETSSLKVNALFIFHFPQVYVVEIITSVIGRLMFLNSLSAVFLLFRCLRTYCL